jgi:hypothetical protein
MTMTTTRDDDDPLHLFFFGRQRGRQRGRPGGRVDALVAAGEGDGCSSNEGKYYALIITIFFSLPTTTLARHRFWDARPFIFS